MKKIFLLILLLSTCATIGFAQKRKGSTYIKTFDIKAIHPLDYKAKTTTDILLTGPVKTVDNKVKMDVAMNHTCLPSNPKNSIIHVELITSEVTPIYDANGKFLMELKVYLMVNYEAQLIIKNANNEILATKKLNSKMGIPVLEPISLTGLSENSMGTFNTVVTFGMQKLNDRTIEKATAALNRYFCGYSGVDTMSVYSGKGKLFDYTELDAAQETMKSTTVLIGLKKEDTTSTKTNLLKLIETWKKEIATADLTNPEARISLEVYRGLQYNLATAYYFLKDYKTAEVHAAIARFDPTEKDQKVKIVNDFEKKVENLQFLIDLNLYF